MGKSYVLNNPGFGLEDELIQTRMVDKGTVKKPVGMGMGDSGGPIEYENAPNQIVGLLASAQPPQGSRAGDFNLIRYGKYQGILNLMKPSPEVTAMLCIAFDGYAWTADDGCSNPPGGVHLMDFCRAYFASAEKADGSLRFHGPGTQAAVVMSSRANNDKASLAEVHKELLKAASLIK